MGRTVLVIGSGGREHALGWGLANSPSVDRVESAPGNPGLAELGPVHEVVAEEPAAVVDLADSVGADLVVVGPEAPLVAGLADALDQRSMPVFGPSARAAEIEGSKAFAKDVMRAAGVPTGHHDVASEAPSAMEALDRYEPPYVVKADGLAAGKGVVLCDTRAEAEAAIEDAIVRRRFGSAGETVVLEEYLNGPEVSIFAVCDGTDAVLLPPAQDFKRAHDGDAGPNTGGMGAYTPIPGFGLAEAEELHATVFRPVLRELRDRGRPYVGLLYAGLVLTEQGPKVLEFNCRFGDPETQVVIPRITSDLSELLAACVDPRRGVRHADVAFGEDAAVTVVLASGGYPGTYEVGYEVTGLDAVAEKHPDVLVFHAGTAVDDGRLVTEGGRVLSVTGRGGSVAAARDAAYAAADDISWNGLQRREDIALEAARR